MKCNVCETESLDENECSFCGETIKLDFFETRELKQPNEKLFRLKMNKWANSISDHEFMNLGDQVTFKKINSHPAHAFGVETIYEKRELSYRYFVGNKNRTRNRSIDIDDIDPWKLSLDYTKGEKKGGDYVAYNLLNDDKTINTVDCEGSGCNSGMVDCRECSNGQQGCSDCRTSGEIKCKACHGSGEINRNGTDIVCLACGGAKFQNCGPCGATGYVPCSTCRGTAEVKCANCQGSGVLDEKIILTGSLTIVNDYHLENERHPGDVKTFHSYNKREGLILLDIVNGHLPETAKNLVPIKNFQDKLDKVLAKHDIVPDKSIIGSRKIWIERKPLIEINYQFKGNDFRLFLVDSKFSPIDDLSPIKSFNKELLKESSKYLTSSKLSEVKKGIENLEKSFRIGQDNDQSEENYESFKEQLGKKIQKSAEDMSLADWTLGMEMINFRDTVLHRKSKASPNYLTKNINKMGRTLVLAGLIGSVVALGATFALAPNEYLVQEVMIAFAILSFALTAIIIGNAIKAMNKNIETKNKVLTKFAITMALVQTCFILAIVEDVGFIILIALGLAFIPLYGDPVPGYKDSDELSSDLDEEGRKVLLSFLEKYKKFLFSN